MFSIGVLGSAAKCFLLSPYYFENLSHLEKSEDNCAISKFLKKWFISISSVCLHFLPSLRGFPTHIVHTPSLCSLPLPFHRPGYLLLFEGTLITSMAYSRQNSLRTSRYSSGFCSGFVPKACGSPYSHSPVFS